MGPASRGDAYPFRTFLVYSLLMERKYNLESLLGRSEETSEFFQLLNRARSRQGSEEPCPEGEDCSEMLSECCGAILSTVFGTLPLEVECAECGRKYVLRELLSSIEKSK